MVLYFTDKFERQKTIVMNLIRGFRVVRFISVDLQRFTNVIYLVQ